jgi:hypothetical protein
VDQQEGATVRWSIDIETGRHGPSNRQRLSCSGNRRRSGSPSSRTPRRGLDRPPTARAIRHRGAADNAHPCHARAAPSAAAGAVRVSTHPPRSCRPPRNIRAAAADSRLGRRGGFGPCHCASCWPFRQ